MLSQSDSTGDEDIQNLLKDWLKIKYEKPGRVFLGLVQRLDRPARGLMVLARTSKAAARLSAQIRERTFKKEYRAVLTGQRIPEGTIVHHLGKNNILKKAIVTRQHDLRYSEQEKAAGIYDGSSSDGKKAVMEMKRLQTCGALSLVDIRLHTGRFHQIRAQLAALDLPIVGDYKYGPQRRAGSGLALMCHRIGFNHPTRDETMHFSLGIPDEYPWNVFRKQDL